MNSRKAICIALVLPSLPVLADGNLVDRVYDPYVQPLETEIEWRTVGTRDSDEDDLDDLWLHRLGIGYGFSDRWFGEVYAIGKKSQERDLDVEALELEAKWQLSEQGEYAADWGMLFELEREFSTNQWEAVATLISAREWGRWTGTANLSLAYEWGSVSDEFETGLRAQARYRWSQVFEPALELYAAEDLLGIGPVVLGARRFDGGRQLRWEVGIIQGLTSESPDQSVRLLLEYEYF
ncbi:hypothetical protein PVT68_09000 [Microbulbifer bruguierae]|uniref:Uncharacterized protein n=1 Tax=Microbulbifer bruguierae TaxID=3029061 RepID=A0ABY8NHL4_9GAMM|nr:hypothetical protein [Microbulbifer bruguierae]WGL18419.1 hypothetical protein PVT68_09000 [Microbulbifer bruguierae]